MAVQRDKVIASAEKLVAKGKIEPAIKEYERLLDDNPNDVNTLNRIGDLWVRINRNDEAVKVFGKIADHYSKDGFFLKAIAIYKKINKLDPSKLDTYARLADLYAKQGLAMEAKSQYQVMADYYLKHGEAGNALSIYRKISDLDPNSINVHVKLADLYSQNNQPAEALKEYDRVGRMLLKRGMLDEAVAVFKKALKNDPRNLELVDSLVAALLEAKDYENARQIVETALESNRDHPRLLAMLGRIQSGRGDHSAARATLERALAADPNEASVRDALTDLYLRHNDADHALEMVVPLVERSLSRGERHAAIEQLNRILRVDSGHTPTLERLVALYQRLNEETNVLSAMNSLAEAHITRTRFDEAAKVLDKLVQREPQNSQHRTKLQFVRSQIGGIDTIPAGTKAAPAPLPDLPPMEIEEPAPSFDFAEEPGLTMDMALDSGPAIELDLPAEPAPAPEPPPAPAPTPRMQSAVEIASIQIQEEEDEDLDFITEHLTEAEVFAKYGLAEKATEHLRVVIERAPKNLTAHERLVRILSEEGDSEAAVAAAQTYIAILREKGDDEAVETARADLLARGISLPAAAPPTAPTVERAMPAAEDAEEPAISFDDLGGAGGGITLEEAGSPEFEFDLEAESAPLPAAEEAVEEVIELAPEAEEIEEVGTVEEPEPVEEEIEFAEEPQAAAVPELEVSEPEPLPDFEEPSLAAEPEPAAVGASLLEVEEPILEIEEPEPTFEEPEAVGGVLAFEIEEPEPTFDAPPAATAEPVLELEESVLDLNSEAVAAEEAAEPFFGVEGMGRAAELEELPLEEIGEIDFYLEQELFEEARRKLDSLQARFPDNDDLETRRARLEAALEAAPGAPERPPVLSRAEIETELLSAIPADDEEIAASPPAAMPAPPPPAISAALVQEENLFADEDNFFDLAAELESELAEEEEPIALAEEEQSLEEIFKEFKKGVEQQLDSEDYDTHYNLGIAYKEMGLIDEAIGEFQLASKDPKRAVECASMLGLCFLEKGMPQLAIKWYRKGLEMPEITEEEHMGLLYDLGAAYQEVGDTGNAQKAFLEVYGMNTNYRDVVARMKQLEDATKK